MYWNVLFHITAWKSNAPAGNKTKVTGLYTRLKHQKGNDFPYTQQDHQTLPSMHSIWFFSMSACKTTLYFSTLFIEKIGVYKYIYICICVRILCTHIMYAYHIYHYMGAKQFAVCMKICKVLLSMCFTPFLLLIDAVVWRFCKFFATLTLFALISIGNISLPKVV